MGDLIREMVAECQKTQQRVNQIIEIKAYTYYMTELQELIARFELELSLKYIKD